MNCTDVLCPEQPDSALEMSDMSSCNGFPVRHLIVAAALAIVAATPAAAQSPTEIQAALDAAYAKYKDIQEGANADYIPALAKVDPEFTASP